LPLRGMQEPTTEMKTTEDAKDAER